MIETLKQTAKTESAISYKELVELQRNYFNSGVTRSIDFRIEQLRKLKNVIQKYEKDIVTALNKDLGKHEFEAYASEILFLYNEIDYAIKHIRSWAKPQRVPTSIFHFIGSSYLYKDPYGVVLNISPWNYPIQLAISPVIGAITAGNCCIIKPSEVAAATSALVTKFINDNFEPHFLHVIEGDAKVTSELLKEKFDYIFFTGGTSVGKIVYEAAAKNLTPVTLELGGKSPCIVDKDVNLTISVRRILWGKYMNAGQTCVAPDYIYIHKDIKKQFLDVFQNELNAFYGIDILNNQEYGKIINERHFQRLMKLMEGNKVLLGGKSSATQLKIEPTILEPENPASGVMNEEIFGPLLPLIEFEKKEEVVNYINSKPKPLALYVFSNNIGFQDFILENTSSGGVSINETIMHMTNPNMPFGGVGDSGIGGYHGKFSFDTFTHKKAVMKRSFLIDAPLRYPPFNKISISRLKFLVSKFL